MKKVLITLTAVLFFAGIALGSVDSFSGRERPAIDLSTVPDSAFEKGVISIKFKPTLTRHLDITPQKNGPDGFIRFGITGIDAVGKRYKARKSSLVFGTSGNRAEFTKRHRSAGLDRWYRLELDSAADVRRVVAAFKSLPDVEIAEPEYKKKQLWMPNDPRFNEQWHYHNTGQQGGTPDCDIDLPEAWEITRGNSNVIVAVIDGGIQYDHPDIAANMWSGIGYNFALGNSTIVPESHATHVAGTIAALTNNTTGVSGIAGGSGSGDGVRLMSCQVFSGDSAKGFANAFMYAADNGAAIAQNSWGYTVSGVCEQAVLEAIDYFDTTGGGSVLNDGITVFAAGNDNSSGLWWPGCYSRCLSVAATNNKDQRSYYSNFDTWVDISAPGGAQTVTADPKGILSTYTTSTYNFIQGTSMACPHVSGVAALIISLAPVKVMSNNDVRDLLLASADNHYAQNPQYLGMLGTGRLNAHQALLKTGAYLSAKVDNPVVFSAASSSTTQISLSWTKNSGNNDVMIVWNGTPSFGTPSNGASYTPGQTLPGGGTVVYAGSGTAFNHAGLTNGTKYFYRIWSKNGANQYSIGKNSWARTKFDAVTAFPFTEGFENGVIPDGWSEETGTPAWQYFNGDGYGINGIPVSAHTGSFNAALTNFNTSALKVNKLVTPPLDLSFVTNCQLTFWHAQARYYSLQGTFQDKLKVFYRTSETGPWVQLASYTKNVAAWTQRTITLPDVSSSYYIAFEGTITYGWGVCLDDISITGTVSTPSTQAGAVGFSAVGSSQMNVSWTKGSGNRRAVFMKQDPLGTAAPVNNTAYAASAVFGSGAQIGTTGWYCVYNDTGASVAVSGLAAGTEYRAMVCEYNGTGGIISYNTSTATDNPDNQTTLSSAPSAPELAAPLDAATGIAPVPTLSWNAVIGAETYQLQVALDAAFTAPLYDESAITATEQAIGPLAACATFFWRVNAANAGGTSAWSSARSFRVNCAPVLAAIGDKSVNEAQLLTFGVTASDPDGTTPTLRIEPLPDGATFAGGVFAWTPTFSQSGTWPVKFIATDGTLADTEAVTITVNDLNRVPVLALIGGRSVDEAQLLTFTVSASDPDGTTPTLSAESLPAGATFAGGAFSWTPTHSQSGSYPVLFIASDGTLSDSETVSIDVADVNQPPVLAAIGGKSIDEMQALTFPVSATDGDGTTPVVSAEQLPEGATFIDNTFTWTPTQEQSGSFTVLFIAADGSAADSEYVLISVGDVNRPPVITSINDTTINEAQPLTLTVTATDPDGTTPALDATGLPTGAKLTDNGNGTAVFSWTPGYDKFGTYPITVSATDGIATATEPFTITVNNTNRKPVLSAAPFYSVVAGQSLQFTVSASDPDATPVTLSATGVPAGALFTDNGDNTGSFTWTPIVADEGEYSVKVVASDGELQDSVIVKVVVLEKTLGVGLAGYWRFDEAGGIEAVDGSGMWHNGTLIDGATRVPDVPAALGSGTSLALSGGSQYVCVNGMGLIDTYTVSLWLKCGSSQSTMNPRVIDYGDRRAFLYLENGSKLVYYVKSAAGKLYGGLSYDLGNETEWHHVAALLKGDTLRLYVDGVKRGEGKKTGELSTVDDVLYIGSENGIYSFNGGMDDVRLYSRVLNIAEIAALYGGGSGDLDVAPFVAAGNDRSLINAMLPVSLALNGQAKDDHLTVPELIIRWWKVAGPDAVTILDPTVLSTNAAFSAGGTYVMQLSVNDGVNTSYDTLTVVVGEALVNLSDSLSGYWRFDELSGTEAVDGSGKWHGGTLIGGATRVADIPAALGSGTSLALSGGSQYVRVSGMGLIDTYTISLWLKRGLSQSTMNPRVINYGDRRAFLYLENGSKLVYYVKSAAGKLYGGLSYDLGSDTKWHHIGVVLKGDTLRLYVDGVKRGEGQKIGALSVLDDGLHIGSEDGVYSFNGGVDDVRMHSRALNVAEISALYGGGGGDLDVAPFVAAGNDSSFINAMLPISLALNGQAEDDHLTVPELTVRWRKIAGSDAVTILDSTVLSTNAAFSAGGTYMLQLSVNDGVNTSYDTLTVVVGESLVNLSDDMVGYWRFDEAGGTEAIDGSGMWHNGTLIDGATRVPDVPTALGSGTSLALSGGSQYVRVNGMGLIDTYTVSLWLKCGSSQSTMNPRVIEYGDRRAFLYLENGRILKYYVKNNSGKLYGGLSYDLGSDTEWHHVAALLKGDTLRLYVDGVKRGEGKKTGELSTIDDVLYIGAENGIYCLNGGVDEVLMYGRALNIAEITALANGQSGDIGTQLLSYMQLNDQKNQIEPVQQINFSDDFTNLNNFTDLSSLIPWGSTSTTGFSAFTTDTSKGRPSVFLAPEALLNMALDTLTALRSFSALDYRFPNVLSSDTEVIAIEFSAKPDTGSYIGSGPSFNVILMNNYPDQELTGLDINNFNGNPYGTPAYSIKISPCGNQKSYLQYGGANGGQFDNYQYQWWLPGSVSPTDCSASGVTGEGQEYPLSSWKSSERAMGDTSWARYTWLVRPDCMEIYKNDTLYGTMDLPAYSYTLPGYTRYDQFKALRLAWQGQCYVSDLSITTMPAASAPNRPPRIAFVNPLHDTTVLAGSGFYLQADASDLDGSVDRVEFYANNQLLSASTSVPYAFSWQSVPEGTNKVTVAAIDDQGAVSVGKVLKIKAVSQFSVK